MMLMTGSVRCFSAIFFLSQWRDGFRFGYREWMRYLLGRGRDSFDFLDIIQIILTKPIKKMKFNISCAITLIKIIVLPSSLGWSHLHCSTLERHWSLCKVCAIIYNSTSNTWMIFFLFAKASQLASSTAKYIKASKEHNDKSVNVRIKK